MARYLDWVNRIIWGVPALVLILGVGVYLSIQTNFAQIRFFPGAVRHFLTKLRRDPENGGISPVQALCTALAATVGTGNLVGVAGAIALGGPGSIFWMWVCGLLGMVIKFAEATLAVRYHILEKGEYVAGPMYMIRTGLGPRWRFLAVAYCLFGVVAALGVGNAVQVNAVIAGMNAVIEFCGGSRSVRTDLLMGLVLAVLIGMMLLGGAKRIGQTAELLMPLVCCCYVAVCLGVLLMRFREIPHAFSVIFRGAFSPKAVSGGVIGSVFQTLRIGISRGVFTNEAGMGTASIAHGGAETAHPVEQGFLGIVEVFLDTVVICTLTALVILCSGVNIPYGTDAGVQLTFDAFSYVCGPWVKVFLGLAMCCLAFGTVLGWGLYGARCAQYLFGCGAWKVFALVQTVVVFLSTLLGSVTIWSLAESVNGLMAIPNLLALVMLTPKLRKLVFDYKKAVLD